MVKTKKNKTLTTNQAIESGRSYFSKTSDVIIKVAAIVGAVTILAGAYSYYINNIWIPKVEILDVDFSKAFAKVKIGTREIYIYGDATFMLNTFGDWGIKFGSSKSSNTYDRLELTNIWQMVKYLAK